MAGPFQIGDIVSIGKVCWDLYHYGWDKDHNATKQYAEFGRDVRGLAENLDILNRVVLQAEQSLRRDVSFSKSLRWDPSSLGEIIGDYRATLEECFDLIDENKRYCLGSRPLRNIEWNVLVAPAAERLRARIALHNSKIIHVLKPFEIDLLYRIREDINQVHIAIQAVHGDLHRLIGVLVPDLQQALDQQAHREEHSLELPVSVDEGLQKAWSSRPASDDATTSTPPPSLQELTDAFVLHLDNSTINFTPVGILVENKIPPLCQYLNLLKCIWLKKHLHESPELSSAVRGVSHWPSYVQQLEDCLSTQCARFKQDLVKPSLEGMTPEMLEIWPEKELPQLVDVVTKDVLMEQILDIPLQGSGANVQRRLQLLRRMGTDGRRFRVNITGVEHGSGKSARRQAETIDFDMTTVILNPLYAVPSRPGVLDMILRKDERIAKLSFTGLKDVIKFQQGVTGFKAFDNYCQYDAMVIFVMSGRDEPLVEDACVQFWIPKQLHGQLVTNNEALVKDDAYAGTTSSPIPAGAASPPGTGSMSSWWNTTASSSRASWARRPSTQSNPAVVSGGMSLNPLSSRPAISIPHRPAGSAQRRTSAASPTGQTGGAMSASGLPSSSKPFPGSWPSARAASVSTVNSSRADRTLSVSSNVSTTTSTTRSQSNNSSGNNSEAHNVTVSIGGRTTGTVHRRPPKPMMTLFVQNRSTRRLALVTVEIDEDTEVNPDRCNCRQSGRHGASCPIAAIEQKRGAMNLSARRFESRDGDVDWNLANLALGRQGQGEGESAVAAIWKDVRRISIMFPTPEARASFGGTPNKCQCRSRTEGDLARCLAELHKGKLGLVREFGRQQLNEYHKTRFGSRQEVVRGMRDD